MLCVDIDDSRLAGTSCGHRASVSATRRRDSKAMQAGQQPALCVGTKQVETLELRYALTQCVSACGKAVEGGWYIGLHAGIALRLRVRLLRMVRTDKKIGNAWTSNIALDDILPQSESMLSMPVRPTSLEVCLGIP